MTGNLKLLTNFVEKFLTVKFGNDQIAPIFGYEDLVQGKITIKRVYYVKGPNHSLFSVGQFCDADLEVAFGKSTCYIRDLNGNDLLTGSRDTDLYSITLQDTSTPNLIFLMAKATLSQAWLWHCRLSHLNFDSINLLSKNDIVIGLPKLIFVKDHLFSSYHPLEQIVGNPSQSIRTRRQLETDGDMCMFALTEGIDFEESFAPVAQLEAVRLFVVATIPTAEPKVPAATLTAAPARVTVAPSRRRKGLILLVERRYPLSRFTLDQMLNAARLQVEEESEVSLEMLRFTRQQHQEGQLE
nr:retrovirus-related Pol polyprotein from transposon TNT 1-94 [Tanacetum cinerariifolium]